jgi:hypothetical protein
LPFGVEEEIVLTLKVALPVSTKANRALHVRPLEDLTVSILEDISNPLRLVHIVYAISPALIVDAGLPSIEVGRDSAQSGRVSQPVDPSPQDLEGLSDSVSFLSDDFAVIVLIPAQFDNEVVGAVKGRPRLLPDLLARCRQSESGMDDLALALGVALAHAGLSIAVAS